MRENDSLCLSGQIELSMREYWEAGAKNIEDLAKAQIFKRWPFLKDAPLYVGPATVIVAEEATCECCGGPYGTMQLWQVEEAVLVVDFCYYMPKEETE